MVTADRPGSGRRVKESHGGIGAGEVNPRQSVGIRVPSGGRALKKAIQVLVSKATMEAPTNTTTVPAAATNARHRPAVASARGASTASCGWSAEAPDQYPRQRWRPIQCDGGGTKQRGGQEGVLAYRAHNRTAGNEMAGMIDRLPKMARIAPT